MEGDPLRYDRWIEEALRQVVRRALEHTAHYGLPGEHHFYITFQTGFPGVRIPDYLSAQYPDDMTIVLQNRFWDLEVTEETCAVTLTFSGRKERLIIPLSAVVAFADPSVKFGLQLRVELDGNDVAETLANGDETKAAEPAADDSEAGPPSKDDTNVVALDTFRKK